MVKQLKLLDKLEGVTILTIPRIQAENCNNLKA